MKLYEFINNLYGNYTYQSINDNLNRENYDIEEEEEEDYDGAEMIRIIPINDTHPTHLKEVIDEMRKMGPPTIKAYYHNAYDAWVALNGSHRISAAKILGLPIIIEEYDYDEISERLLSEFTEIEHTDDETIEDYNFNSLDRRLNKEVEIKAIIP